MFINHSIINMFAKVPSYNNVIESFNILVFSRKTEYVDIYEKKLIMKL